MNTENRSRFVLLCQQALACAVVVAVAAPAAGIVTLDIVAPSPGAGATAAVAGALVASAPVEPDVREVPLTETHAQAASNRKQSIDPEGLSTRLTARAVPTTPDQDEAVSGTETVHGFGSIGVTWDGNDVVDHDDISIEVRTLQAGTWSDWQEMHYDDNHGPDAASPETYRAGTDAVVVGDVDDVQVRATTVGAELPSDMRLSIIDPGQTTGPKRQQPAIDTARLSSATTSGTVPSDPATTTPVPTPRRPPLRRPRPRPTPGSSSPPPR